LVPTGYQRTVCSSAGSTLRALVEPTRAGVADEVEQKHVDEILRVSSGLIATDRRVRAAKGKT
jgi:hypothetical protein